VATPLDLKIEYGNDKTLSSQGYVPTYNLSNSIM